MAGNVQQPAATASGEVKYVFENNLLGFQGFIRLPAGPAPAMEIGTAGFGFRVLSRLGVPLFTVSEAGVITPVTMGIPDKAADPAPGSPKQIYYHTGEGVVKIFDGTNSYAIALAP